MHANEQDFGIVGELPLQQHEGGDGIGRVVERHRAPGLPHRGVIPELLVGKARHRAQQQRQRFLAAALFRQFQSAVRGGRRVGRRGLLGRLGRDYAAGDEKQSRAT